MRTWMLVVVLVFVGFGVTARQAQAGGCPTCTKASDCPNAGDFCVLHSADVGCGAQRMLCCPGQGCNTFSGRPSCEGTTCTVVGGSATPDASVPRDGSTATPDGGTAGTDAGGGNGDGEDSGCSCRTGVGASSPASSALGGLLALGALGLVLARRRRR